MSVLDQGRGVMVKAIAFWAALLLCVAAQATVGLYSAQVPVQGQSQADWSKAVQQGLGDVLVKVSGREHADQSPNVRQALKQAHWLVQSYRYVDEQQGQGTQTYLRVDYQDEAVKHLLRSVGLPIWSSDRPMVLFWLVHEQSPDHGVMLGSDEPLGKQLKQQAAHRGLDVVLPLMDLSERDHVDLARVRAFDVDYIRSLSKRYDADEIVVGVDRASERMTWIWLTASGSMTWQSDQASFAENVTSGLDHVIDQLSQEVDAQHAAADIRETDVTITGIHRLEDYAKVLAYLKSLHGVGQVQVRSVTDGALLLRVAMQGGQQALFDTLKNSHHLMLDLEPSAALLSDKAYRWMDQPQQPTSSIRLG